MTGLFATLFVVNVENDFSDASYPQTILYTDLSVPTGFYGVSWPLGASHLFINSTDSGT